jgi:hypothetical protein
MGELSADANLAADFKVSGLKILISWRLHRVQELLYNTHTCLTGLWKSSPPPMTAGRQP